MGLSQAVAPSDWHLQGRPGQPKGRLCFWGPCGRSGGRGSARTGHPSTRWKGAPPEHSASRQRQRARARQVARSSPCPNVALSGTCSCPGLPSGCTDSTADTPTHSAVPPEPAKEVSPMTGFLVPSTGHLHPPVHSSAHPCSVHLPIHSPSSPHIHCPLIRPSTRPLTTRPLTYLSTHPPVHISAHPLICPSTRLLTLPSTHPPLHISAHPLILPSTRPLICLSTHLLSTHPPLHTFTCPLTLLSTHLLVHPSTHPIICPPTCPPIYLPTHSPVHSPTCPPICPPIPCLSTHLPTCLNPSRGRAAASGRCLGTAAPS